MPLNGFAGFLGNQYLAQEPEAAYFRMFPRAAGFGRLGEFMRSRYNPLMNLYRSTLPDEPNLQPQDFFRRFNPEQEFMGQHPRLRGESSGSFSPRVRWLDRY